jgi:predicted Zn-dependent protease
LTQAVQRDPASVIAWQQRALANSVLADRSEPGTLDQAVRDLEMVVQIEPGWALNHANLGALYMAQNRPQEAVRALEDSLRRAPGCGLCALNLGVAYEASGNQAGAEQAYQQAWRLGSRPGLLLAQHAGASRPRQPGWHNIPTWQQ